jgi:cytochrome c-type biogenesis protein CcmH/NrfF
VSLVMAEIGTRRFALACLMMLAGASTLLPAQATEQPPARPSTAASTDPILEARTREVASQLRCVVCQGLSIEDSPSELALEMKALVREQLASGKSPDEVKRYFVDKYGEWILLRPKAQGFNLVVYLLPIVFVLGGIAFVVLAVRRWTRGNTTADESAA